MSVRGLLSSTPLGIVGFQSQLPVGFKAPRKIKMPTTGLPSYGRSTLLLLLPLLLSMQAIKFVSTRWCQTDLSAVAPMSRSTLLRLSSSQHAHNAGDPASQVLVAISINAWCLGLCLIPRALTELRCVEHATKKS